MHQSIRAVCLWLAIAAAGPSAYGQPPAPPPWTVDDQIRIARVAGEMDDQPGPPFRYSPTGDLVAFVTVTSDLATDLTEARLRVWQVRAIQRFAQGADGDTPAPMLDFAVRSSANHLGIADVKWTADGAALLFLVREREGANALYRWVARPARAPEIVATLDSVISGYDMLAQDRVVLYSDPAPVGKPAYVPELANGRPLQALINEVWAYPPQLRSQRLHVLHLNDRVLREIDGYIVPALGTFPSPDGNYVIATDVFDADWNGKCWRPRYHPTPVARRQGIGLHQLRYVIVDVRRRTTEPATGGPGGFVSGARSVSTVHWASDSTRV